MIEAVFAFTMLLVNISLLVFLAYRESEYKKETNELRRMISEAPYNLQKIAIDFVTQRNKDFDTILGRSFDKYLKHIQTLEKMVLPKKVSVKEEDVANILRRSPEMSEYPFKNDIEEDKEEGIALTEQNFGRIPIDDKTQIQFEGDDITADLLD